MASSTIAAVKQNEMKKAHRRQPNRSTAGKLRRRLQRAFNTPQSLGHSSRKSRKIVLRSPGCAGRAEKIARGPGAP
jgi:hypothetical protein